MRGRHALLAGGGEHRALLELAYLPGHLWNTPWDALTGEQRLRLVQAARKAVEFGRQCAWIFGEGRGA